jgi:hypothetical protein
MVARDDEPRDRAMARGSPAGVTVDRPAGLAAYVPPAIGFDVLKDAVALIGCSAAGDGEGVMAILSSTTYPRDLAGMTATVAVIACRRAGLDADAMAALLGDAGADLADLLLDQGRSPQ